jgi:hypothetical protein
MYNIDSEFILRRPCPVMAPIRFDLSRGFFRFGLLCSSILPLLVISRTKRNLKLGNTQQIKKETDKETEVQYLHDKTSERVCTTILDVLIKTRPPRKPI